MKIKTKINKNLIAISFVSTLLIFWLSTTFWLDAYEQRSAAAQLQQQVKPEATLFELGHSLAVERSLLHKILAQPVADAASVDAYYRHSLSSKTLLNEALMQLKMHGDENRHLARYSGAHMLKNVTQLYDELQQKQADVFSDSSAGAAPGKLFDTYVDLIDLVNILRIGSQYLPRENYQRLTEERSLKNAIWDLGESTMQMSAMLDGYLIKSAYRIVDGSSRDGLLHRIAQQRKIKEKAIFEISRVVDQSGLLEPALVDTLQGLSDVSDDYAARNQHIVEQISRLQATNALSQRAWETSRTQMENVIQVLTDDVAALTLVTARAIESNANKKLAKDTILVLLCVGMAVLSFGIAKKVQYQATHDDLTRLPNRRCFAQNLCEAVDQAEQSGRKLVLLSIDLNKFKSINDSLGHAVGDRLLQLVAERLNACVDERMCVARQGGDEFSIFYQPGNDIEPLRLASRIITDLEKAFTIENGAINIGASIGVSYYPKDGASAQALQISADYAMFFAKREGKRDRKSCVECFRQEMADEFEGRLTLETDLGIALEQQQLELYYQPQFNLAKNQVDAVEALVRWNHPQRGLVSPVDFISVAEDCGLMPELGKWVLDEACRQASRWLQDTDFGLRVAVNVSVHQIMQKDFVEQVISTLDRHNLDTDAIELELTESVFMADSEWVVKSLMQLREAGIKIALDDFGTGYSSLSQLQDLPVSTIKIDRSFISRLNAQPNVSHSVTATIASIADVLGLETVAEGVESDMQLDQVAGLGINMVQGFFYSKPMASNNIPEAIASLNQMPGGMPRAA